MRASRGEVLLGRFWSRVAVTDGCWEWTGHRLPAGYGRIKVVGKERSAHRVSWELANGPIPDGSDVLHRCDNPPCVRLDHLFLGTQADNARDMVAKGRGLTAEQQASINHPRGDAHWARKHPERITRGGAHGRSKLTEEKVREIRRLSREGWSGQRLAVEFGVSDANISAVIHRQTWAHVE